MGGTLLALERRLRDPQYAERWFVGDGIDVGAGGDPLAAQGWPRARIRSWDVGDGDGTVLRDVPDESLDFVYSSHMLEHVDDPVSCVRAWWRVLRPGGYLIVVVPHWDLYEHGCWPSRHNGEHRTRWTAARRGPPVGADAVLESLLDVVNVASRHRARLQKLELLDRGYDPAAVDVDQTCDPHRCECGVEIIVKKESL